MTTNRNWAGYVENEIQVLGQPSLLHTSILPVVPFSKRAFGIGVKSNEILLKGPLGAQKLEMRLTGDYQYDAVIGVLRWGYCSPDDDLLESFIEMGWIVLRSPGTYQDVSTLPPDKHLVVVMRWSRASIGWLCTLS